MIVLLLVPRLLIFASTIGIEALDQLRQHADSSNNNLLPSMTRSIVASFRATSASRHAAFELTQRYGEEAAFVSAGGYHHHIGLNTWESRDGSPPPKGTTGLYHFAILYPTRAALADALRRLMRANISLEGASDHGVSEALYLSDPDGNGIELYWDRPKELWPRDEHGQIEMSTRQLELNNLLGEL